MKLTSILAIFCIAGGAAISIVVIKPYWEELKRVETDCVMTKPSQRTPAQKEHCKPTPPVGHIIPGIL